MWGRGVSIGGSMKIRYEKLVSGKIVYHRKAKIGDAGCSIEPELKRGLEYVSIGLGYKKTNENIEIDEAKCALYALGWVLFDDVAEFFGEEAAKKLVKFTEDKNEKFLEE